MAWSQTLVANEAASPRAALDLRGYQYWPVQVAADGLVRLALPIAGSLAGAPVFVLRDKPNSGDTCGLASPPNTVYAFCNGSTYIGAHVVVTTSGGFSAGSEGSVGRVGFAWEAVNSGGVFALKLR